MLTFISRFLICNIFICLFICILIAVKRTLKNKLSSRVQYNLWFLLLLLLTVPFLPLRPISFLQILSYLNSGISAPATQSMSGDIQSNTLIGHNSALDKINDFAVSISSFTPSTFNIILLSLWIIGMLAMTILLLRSWKRLHHLQKSALPLQNQQVRQLFTDCLSELGIKRTLPIYSTAFLKSPVTVGFFRPCIYMPIHLISDFDSKDMRYMLLHELQHYRYKDVLVGHFSNLAGIVYWFNPFVWYALKEMRLEREIACDASVLQILPKTDYLDYGNTLINFAEKISLSPFPFAAGIGSNMKQMKRRILGIAKFKRASFYEKICGMIAYLLIAVFLLGFSPLLSTYAADSEQYTFQENGERVNYLDLENEFNGYQGSFVLYDENTSTWSIYDKHNALKRVTPNSTYKIYDALLGLESGIISPEQSTFIWNGEDYPFDAWESDQDLTSAMQGSVNWYFQNIDSIAGIDNVKAFLQKIGYGNQNLGNNLALYWTDFSLKISPLEQVELLKKFYQNDFDFSEQNINAVKKSILLSSTANSSLSGKTGTGRVDGKDVNGWFIGYIENSGHVYYFATNIQSSSNATGSEAAQVTSSILSKLHLWE